MSNFLYECLAMYIPVLPGLWVSLVRGSGKGTWYDTLTSTPCARGRLSKNATLGRLSIMLY